MIEVENMMVGILKEDTWSICKVENMMVKPLLGGSEWMNKAKFSSTVFGPTCDSTDMVVAESQLPELHMNDVLVFYNMGAYTASAGTRFNGFDISSISTFLTYVYRP